MIGFTNGCFDLLHEGHLHFLRECRKFCDTLHVGLNTDVSVRMMKGFGRPADPWALREAQLKTSGLVDLVFAFSTDEQLRTLIFHLHPDVLYKGMEYDGKQIVGAELVNSVILIPMLDGYSTTQAIKERMQ